MVVCPACNAQPGQRCTVETPSARRAVTWHHWSRINLAGVQPDAGALVCAECGTTKAESYVVTILDRESPKETRTEVCLPCHQELDNPTKMG